MKNAKTLLLVDRDDLRAVIRELLLEREAAKPARQYLTAQDAAKMFSISESKIRQTGAEHPEVIVRIGKAVRFDPDRLREAIFRTMKKS
jgi:hypothetical protein